MNIKNTMSFFGIILVLCLVTMGVIKIWMPESISNESFVKMVVTFGLLTLGSLAISFLSKSSDAKKDDKDA